MFPGKTHGGLPHKYLFFVLQAARCLHQSRCTNRGRHFRLKSTQVFCRHFVLLLFRKDFFWQHWIIFENIHFWKYPKPWLLSLQEIEACSHNSFLSNLKLWQEFGPGHRSRCFNIFGVKTINLLNVEWEQIFLIPNNYVDLFWDFLVHCGCDIMLQSSFSQVSLEIYNKSVHLPNLLKPQQAFTMVKLFVVAGPCWWAEVIPNVGCALGSGSNTIFADNGNIQVFWVFSTVFLLQNIVPRKSIAAVPEQGRFSYNYVCLPREALSINFHSI